MDPINIPKIDTTNTSIPNIQVNGTGIKFIRKSTVGNNYVNVNQIADQRVWLQQTSVSIPQAPPVTINAGTPIVNMPGCVTVNKENAKNPANKNKMLVNDDPKQNVTLCDAGMPYYEPPEYDYRELSWQTVYMDQDEEAGGVDTGDPEVGDLDTPEPPPTPPTGGEDPDCPAPNARRIGDLNQAGTEKVKEYELQIDKNNPDGPKICVTLWEDVGTAEKFLPSVGVVTTTASIAAVATTSALLAKPLADLLLKVIKPAVKKVLGKIQTMMGKTPYRPTQSEIQTNQYREKKGMLPLKFGKKKMIEKAKS
tara:strand:+ start:1099 stop:2025 length:927 start_codon:yes stop_codon:yes gene_type:complete